MFKASLQEIAATLERANSGSYSEAVDSAVDVLVEAFSKGRKLLVFGNGGSATDAQHICGELVGRFMKERSPLSAIALTANQAVITAWANDHGYDEVFSRQIQAHGRPGDVAMGLSTSGTSRNVCLALQIARESGLKTIGLTGEDGSSLFGICDVLLRAPSRSTPRIQEVHLITYHSICAAVESRLFP